LYILDSSARHSADFVDDLILMKILGKLVNNIKSDDNEDVHDAQCASCQMKPIRHIDRYHCLECSSSSSSYDLCGRCFEKRCETKDHYSGHPMVHFKLPNEFLGIHINNINDINLNKLKQFNTLQYEKHDGIICNGICNQKNFIGLRFKCDNCPNYDLCETCALNKHVCTKMHKKDHPIILTSNRVMPKIDPDDIELGEVLGRGAFGKSKY
jgi:hypothetical protein